MMNMTENSCLKMLQAFHLMHKIFEPTLYNILRIGACTRSPQVLVTDGLCNIFLTQQHLFNFLSLLHSYRFQ